MYFTWLYDELLDLPQIKDAKKFASETKEKLLKNKTKDTLTDTEIKMLHYLNQVIKATNKSKSTTPKSKEAKKIIREETSKIKDELIQKVPLKEIKQFLLDAPELTNEERFELYYQEHSRVQDKKNGRNLDKAKDYPTIADLIKEQKVTNDNANTVHHRRDLDSLG